MELDSYPEKHVCVCIYIYVFVQWLKLAFQSLSCELVSGKAVSINTGSPIVLVLLLCFFLYVSREAEKTLNLFELFQYR